MNNVLAAVTAGAGDFTHPLMEVREVKKRALIIISTDKGLCGALNTNLLREAAKFDKDTHDLHHRGTQSIAIRRAHQARIGRGVHLQGQPAVREARAISKFAQELFLKGEVDQVDVLYTNFISTLTQKPEVRQLLPIGEIKALDADVDGDGRRQRAARPTRPSICLSRAAGGVLGGLLPHYLNFQVFQFLLEAKASEHSARMVAMKNATDNAKQLIKDLTLEYNKLRQANITRELLEITSAAMAMG